MANKSPFAKSFVQVRFVWGPDGDQHIFEWSGGTRADRSMCGKTDHEIHAGTNDKPEPDITVSKERHAERPLCAVCEKKWKRHPQSPWKAWEQKVKASS